MYGTWHNIHEIKLHLTSKHKYTFTLVKIYNRCKEQSLLRCDIISGLEFMDDLRTFLVHFQGLRGRRRLYYPSNLADKSTLFLQMETNLLTQDHNSEDLTPEQNCDEDTSDLVQYPPSITCSQ
jgi:hypothetical protein